MRVRAIVVAVERYAVGPSWDLDGPVLDACRYIRWLRMRGVAEDAITLVASPLSVNREAAEGLGLPIIAAEQPVVYDLLTKYLPKDEADALIVAWGGHGAIDGEGNRRLFFADASEQDKRNLDFNSFMNALMTAYYPYPQHQVLFVDACQNLTSDLQFVGRLPRQTLPDVPHLMPDRQQHVLFAASPGQVALNDSRRKTGLFSDELLHALEEVAAPWPPDAAWLARRLDDRFTKLRSDGITRQRPPYLWRRTPNEEGLVFGLQPAEPSRLPLFALAAVVDAMLMSDELASVPNLQNLISLLPIDIRGAVPYAGDPRIDIIRLLRTCEVYSQGRAALVMVLTVGMRNRADLARILETLDRSWPA